jgi:myo-inositol 2-dehydrogenase/D-chiro-inositol 1-dehydrogenase
MLRFCIFGAGQMGQVHARTIAENPGGTVHSVVDVDAEAAQRLADAFGADIAPGPESALADPAVDAVVIATPAAYHSDLVIASAQAGKAIFCEKPLAEDSDAARTAVKAVQQTRVPSFMGFMKRFWPGFRAVEEKSKAGQVGKIEMVFVTNRDPKVTILDYLRATHETAPYALIRESTVHDFDMIRALLGEDALEVFVAGSSLVDPEIAALGEYDTAMITLRTASGALGHINNSWRAVYGYDQRVEVYGSMGMLRAENRPETSAVHFTAAGAKRDRLFSGPPDSNQFFLHMYADTYAAEMAHFIEAVESGVQPAITVEDGLRAQLLIEAALESIRTNRPAKVQS